MSFISFADHPATMSSPLSPAQQRLTLEEKLWFDRRKSELQQFAGFGAAVGAATGAAVTCALF